MKFVSRPLSVLVCTLFLIGAPASAAEPRKTVHFGVMELVPYGFFDENRKPHGDLFEISHAIQKEGGFDGKVVIEPIRRLTKSFLERKELDCFIAGNVPWIFERYQLVEPIGINADFGLLPRQGVSLKTYDDLKDLKIGVPLGVTIGGAFDTDGSLTKIEAPNYESGIMMLAGKRFDAIAGVMGSLKFNARRKGIAPDALGKPFVVKKVPLALFCRFDFANAARATALQAAVSRLRESGTIKDIVARYR